MLIALAVASGLILGVYATTFFSVSNTATIQTGANLEGTGPVTQGTVCAASTGTYVSSIPVAWGSVPAGTTQSQFICLENTGTGNYPISVTSNLPIHDGSISTPQSGQVLVPSSFLLVEFDWQIPPGAQLGSLSFSIDFQ